MKEQAKDAIFSIVAPLGRDTLKVNGAKLVIFPEKDTETLDKDELVTALLAVGVSKENLRVAFEQASITGKAKGGLRITLPSEDSGD